MALDEREQAILEERARHLAIATTEEDRGRMLYQVAVVRVGSELIGLPATSVVEILRTPPICPLPGLPTWMPGIVHVRGEVISVVRLADWLHGSSGGNPKPSPFLALLENRHGDRLGVLVDAVVAFRELYEQDVSARFEGDEAAGRLVFAFTQDLLQLVDVERAFKDPSLRTARVGRSPERSSD